MSDDVEAALRAAAEKYSGWTSDELENEFALRRDNDEPTDEIGLVIVARGGNPLPTPEERGVTYEARKILRGDA